MLSDLGRLVVLSCVLLAANNFALKILISNDDSWGTANIHAIYNAAKKAGHQAIISAPAMQMSGTDGIMRKRQILEHDAEFDLIKKGAPAEGRDAKDDHIWYVNTTPASSVKYGLQVLAPRYFDSLPDLVIAGTNQGFNHGLAYLVSGTYGAAKYAIKHGIPGIACSAGNEAIRPYTDLKGADDQANIYAEYVMDLVAQLGRTRKKDDSLLPPGVGLNVNFADANSDNIQTSRRKWVQTRLLSTIESSPVSRFYRSPYRGYCS